MRISTTLIWLGLAIAAPSSMYALADTGSAAPPPTKPEPAKPDATKGKEGIRKFKAKCKKEGLTKAQCKAKWKELHGDKAEELPDDSAAE